MIRTGERARRALVGLRRRGRVQRRRERARAAALHTRANLSSPHNVYSILYLTLTWYVIDRGLSAGWSLFTHILIYLSELFIKCQNILSVSFEFNTILISLLFERK